MSRTLHKTKQAAIRAGYNIKGRIKIETTGPGEYWVKQSKRAKYSVVLFGSEKTGYTCSFSDARLYGLERTP